MPAVKAFRDSHHMVARLFAMGLRSGEVAERSGYSKVRISILAGDPAFQELIAQYRASVNEEWRESVDEYFELAVANRILAARLINDKLADAEPEDYTLNQLVTVHADAADRTGYPKRSIAVNVNMDFAAKLDAAIKRSGQAQSPTVSNGERDVSSHPAQAAPARQPLTIEHEPLKRRA